jgi:hypothetical protein
VFLYRDISPPCAEQPGKLTPFCVDSSSTTFGGQSTGIRCTLQNLSAGNSRYTGARVIFGPSALVKGQHSRDQVFNNSAFMIKFFAVSAELAIWMIKVFTGPTVVINSDNISRIEDLFLRHLEEEENILRHHFFGR